MSRDIRERGDTEASVSKAWAENVLPTHQAYVEPQKARADVVLSGKGDLKNIGADAASVLAV